MMVLNHLIHTTCDLLANPHLKLQIYAEEDMFCPNSKLGEEKKNSLEFNAEYHPLLWASRKCRWSLKKIPFHIFGDHVNVLLDVIYVGLVIIQVLSHLFWVTLDVFFFSFFGRNLRFYICEKDRTISTFLFYCGEDLDIDQIILLAKEFMDWSENSKRACKGLPKH